MEEIRLGDVIQTRKAHPCGSDRWQVIRIGADIKIKCLGCGRVVMMERPEFVKRRKKILEQRKTFRRQKNRNCSLQKKRKKARKRSL